MHEFSVVICVYFCSFHLYSSNNISDWKSEREGGSWRQCQIEAHFFYYIALSEHFPFALHFFSLGRWYFFSPPVLSATFAVYVSLSLNAWHYLPGSIPISRSLAFLVTILAFLVVVQHLLCFCECSQSIFIDFCEINFSVQIMRVQYGTTKMRAKQQKQRQRQQHLAIANSLFYFVE